MLYLKMSIKYVWPRDKSKHSPVCEKFYDQIEGFILPFQIKYLMKLSVLFQVNIYPLVSP